MSAQMAAQAMKDGLSRGQTPGPRPYTLALPQAPLHLSLVS